MIRSVTRRHERGAVATEALRKQQERFGLMPRAHGHRLRSWPPSPPATPSSSVREAKAGKKSSENAKKNLENMLRTRLAKLIFQIDDAKRKASLYKESLVPKALQALKAFDISFRGGKAGYLDLLDAQRVLLQFELVYEKAVSDHETLLAELEMIVGEEF